LARQGKARHLDKVRTLPSQGKAKHLDNARQCNLARQVKAEQGTLARLGKTRHGNARLRKARQR
jgi:hypothetical protein